MAKRDPERRKNEISVANLCFSGGVVRGPKRLGLSRAYCYMGAQPGV